MKQPEIDRGYFGIGIYNPKFSINVGTLYRSAFVFGASLIFTLGTRIPTQSSDTYNSYKHIPYYKYLNLEDLKQHLPYDCPLIGIEISNGAETLSKFSHPHRAIYLLGSEDNGLPNKVLLQCHRILQIPSKLPLCLNVATAGSIVMYDRYIKRNGGYETI